MKRNPTDVPEFKTFAEQDAHRKLQRASLVVQKQSYGALMASLVQPADRSVVDDLYFRGTLARLLELRRCVINANQFKELRQGDITPWVHTTFSGLMTRLNHVLETPHYCRLLDRSLSEEGMLLFGQGEFDRLMVTSTQYFRLTPE